MKGASDMNKLAYAFVARANYNISAKLFFCNKLVQSVATVWHEMTQ